MGDLADRLLSAFERAEEDAEEHLGDLFYTTQGPFAFPVCTARIEEVTKAFFAGKDMLAEYMGDDGTVSEVVEAMSQKTYYSAEPADWSHDDRESAAGIIAEAQGLPHLDDHELLKRIAEFLEESGVDLAAFRTKLGAP